jgi:riboflavin-specific deaminase-like protein
MLAIDVTPGVWERLLAVRHGTACACCGQWSGAERAALELYGPLARRDCGRLTVGQIGQSLDGRIATTSGDAKNVSGADGLLHLHRMRALADGVVIGVRTALNDTPRLTVRLCEGPHPARIVIDPRGRLPDDSPVLRSDGVRRIVIQAVDTPRGEGVEVIRLRATRGRFEPEGIRDALHTAGLTALLIEGGGFTLSKFIERGLLTRLHVAIAPLLIGRGPSGLTLPRAPEKLADSIRPETRVFSLGSDVVFDCGLTPDAAAGMTPQHNPGARRRKS